jgi:hypothetical protein
MGVVRCRAAASLVLAVAMITGAIVGLASPHDMFGGLGWATAVGGVLYGLGGGARRALRIETMVGEQLALGTAVWIFASGVLLAIGHASRGPLFVIAAIGMGLALVELWTHAHRPVIKTAGEDRWVAVTLLGMLAVYLGFVVVAMIGTRGNPYDDHVAYTALVKRLLDCGNLVEPFSFRRLSAYGGQTVLLALAALRGDVDSSDLLDRGIFQVIAVVLVIDMMRRRKLPLGVSTLVMFFLLCLWDLSINSASTWTGFTCFFAAYAFASREDLPPRATLVLALAASAAACTLRQNFILPAGLFSMLLLVRHVRVHAATSTWREALARERATLGIAIAAAAVIVVPYAIAAWASNRTFLFPIMIGTWNPAAPLRPTGGTFYDELAFFLSVTLKSEPLRIWWLLIPFMFLARDTRATQPWKAYLIASCVGFVFLVHSFMLSDPNTLWRYAFGYMTPLALIFYIETASALPLVGTGSRGALRVPALATFLVWVAMLAQLVQARDVPASRFAMVVENVKSASVLGSLQSDPRVDVYHRMQDSIPAGASIAVMLDSPYLLDYDRNAIFNLDLPGFSSPAPGVPAFTDPAHWRAYFTSHGIRYIAFVGKENSTYLFRRAGWLWRMYADDELWRFMAAHMVDAIDTFHELAQSSKVVFHEDGIYAIDLGPEATTETSRDGDELTRMDRYVRHLSETELGSNVWQLASRKDVVFETDGFGPSSVVPMPGSDNPSGGLLGVLLNGPQEEPHRWLMDRTHLRVHGLHRQHLHMKVWVNKIRLFTIPIVTLTLDGKTLARAEPGPDGNVVFDVDTTCSGWCELYLLTSTISEFWRTPDDLEAYKLLELDWTER